MSSNYEISIELYSHILTKCYNSFMSIKSKIPERSLPPLIRKYCYFNLTDFIDFLNRSEEVISNKLNTDLEVEIDISGFDRPFKSANDIKKTLHNQNG